MNRIVLVLTLLGLSLRGAVAEPAPEFLAVPDNFVAEGIPRIPTKLADELHRWTETRAAWLASWHPTRRQMLIGTRFADTSQLHLVKFPEGARTQLTFFSDNIENGEWQPSHGEYFVFSKAIGGDENYQKYRFDLATGAITLFTDGKSRNTDGVWSNRGDRYVYGSTRRTGNDVDLWIVDPAEPKSDRMLAKLEGGGWQPLDFSPDDRKLLVKEFISISDIRLWLFDVASGEKTLLAPTDSREKISYRHAQFRKDGKGLYVSSDRDSEFQHLGYIDLATKKQTDLTPDLKWDIQDEFELSWDGKNIAFMVNEDGLSTLHLLDTATRKERHSPKLPAWIAGGLKWHKNNVDLGFTCTSARNPSDAWSVNVESAEITRWTFSETGGINTQIFVEPSIIKWKSFDERMISGWLYKPPEKFAGKRPVIVEIHGGPEGQSRPAFGAMSNYLVNEMGVALVRPNIRGSIGYGKTFTTLDNGFRREDSYKDIGALLDWIATRDDLDASRIMVTGGSYGGHMTLAVATCYPDRIRCALDVVGPSNLATFLKNTSGYRRDLRRVEYGDERDPAMLEFLNRIAPLNNASRITKPLFIVQGANDPRVPASESEQMVRTLRESNVPVWYLLAKDEGHGFDKRKNEDFLFYATVLFIREHLLK